MFAIPRPSWVVNDHTAMLMDRRSGLVIVLIEERGWQVKVETEVRYFDLSIYLGPIGRYRFWRALLGGYGGIPRVGEGYPHKSLPAVTRDVATALIEIGVLEYDGDKALNYLF